MVSTKMIGRLNIPGMKQSWTTNQKLDASVKSYPGTEMLESRRLLLSSGDTNISY